MKSSTKPKLHDYSYAAQKALTPLIVALLVSGCFGQAKPEDPDPVVTPPVEEADVTAPSRIDDVTAISLSQTSIRVQWSAPGDDGAVGTAQTYEIRYRTSTIDASNWSSSSQLMIAPVPKVSGTLQMFDLLNLTPNTRYYFAIKTRDEAMNESAISNVASVTTDAPPPPVPDPDTVAPSVVSSLSASALSTSSIKLNWTAPGDDGNVGQSSSYDVRYATATITAGNWDGATQVPAEPLPGIAGSAQTMTVKSLNASTKYFFAMQTSDEAGNTSVISNVATATTQANVSGAVTVPGTPASPYPTIQHLSIDWPISGDNDEDGVVSVRYRKAGSANWTQGMNLFRVAGGSNQGFSWGNKQSGSLFKLDADTEYEIELTLSDPDNGAPVQETLFAKTRAVPQAAVSATQTAVTPSTLSAALSAARAGDVLVLGNGSYPGFTVGRSGTPGNPIVIRGISKGGVVINGDVRIDGRHDVYLETLTVNGMVKFNSSENIVVRGTAINTSGSGIVAQGSGTINSYIVDNIVLGSTTWGNNTVGNNGSNVGEGIEITGPGNVVAYNYVKGFRDAISLMEDDEAVNQVSFDIYNNDIEIGADDGIEADFAMGNVRVLNNRITNSYVGLSSQPGLGGPTYFIGNVMYNVVLTPFKLHRGSVGDVALHNTVVKGGDAFGVFTDDAWSKAWFRNNIFIGGAVTGSVGPYGIGNGKVADLRAASSTCSFDYDGFGSINTGSFTGRIGSTSFSSLSAMQANTTEAHALTVDLDIFAASVAFPSTVFPIRAIPDLRLKAGANVVDAGVVIPNINDGYSGAAPDLGAYEQGAALPVYGPRR